MASVLDVAEAILAECGPMDTYRLQKLVYYSQAYFVAKHDDVLFDEPIEAWSNGPTVRRLFSVHRGARHISSVNGRPASLSSVERDAIDHALAFYGEHDAKWLVAQTHLERPWQDARDGLPPTERGDRKISVDALRSYYGPIFNDPEVEAVLASRGEQDGLTVDEIRERYRV